MTEKNNEFADNITELLVQLGNTLSNKNKKYGNSFYEGLDDISELSKIHEHIWEKTHYFSFYVRAKDKLNRIKYLSALKTEDKEDKKNSIFDAVLDLAGYSVLFLNYLRNHEK